jgi:hypothetical protein
VLSDNRPFDRVDARAALRVVVHCGDKLVEVLRRRHRRTLPLKDPAAAETVAHPRHRQPPLEETRPPFVVRASPAPHPLVLEHPFLELEPTGPCLVEHRDLVVHSSSVRLGCRVIDVADLPPAVQRTIRALDQTTPVAAAGQCRNLAAVSYQAIGSIWPTAQWHQVHEHLALMAGYLTAATRLQEEPEGGPE